MGDTRVSSKNLMRLRIKTIKDLSNSKTITQTIESLDELFVKLFWCRYGKEGITVNIRL